MWQLITKIEKSIYNDYSRLVFFNIDGVEKYAILTSKVLKILKVSDVCIGDNIFIIKSFGKDNKPVYFIKKIEREIKNDIH